MREPKQQESMVSQHQWVCVFSKLWGKKQAGHRDKETSEKHLSIVDKLLVMILIVSYEYISSIIMSDLTKFSVTTLAKPPFH